MNVLEKIEFIKGDSLFAVLEGRWVKMNCPKCKGKKKKGYACIYCGSEDRVFKEKEFGVYSVEVVGYFVTIQASRVGVFDYIYDVMVKDASGKLGVEVKVSHSRLFRDKKLAEKHAGLYNGSKV